MAKKNNYKTQWSGQFGVAHELTRRGYIVSLTLGNAPGTDLLCQSPGGKHFSVEVKTQRTKSYYLYQKHLENPNESLHFIFVFLPKSLVERPEYYVLNNQQFIEIVKEDKELKKASEAKRGKKFVEFSPGIHYKRISDNKYRDAWDINLPK